MPIHFNWRLELHPLLVHFPIALLFMAFVFDGIGWLWKSASLRLAGLYCLVAGAVGTVLGVLSGLATPEAREREGLTALQHRVLSVSSFFTGRRVEVHKHWGYVLLALVVLWLAARILAYARRPDRPGMAMIAGALALAVLVATGYSGGELVYGRRGRNRGEAPAPPAAERVLNGRSSKTPAALPAPAGQHHSFVENQKVEHEP